MTTQGVVAEPALRPARQKRRLSWRALAGGIAALFFMALSAASTSLWAQDQAGLRRLKPAGVDGWLEVTFAAMGTRERTTTLGNFGRRAETARFAWTAKLLFGVREIAQGSGKVAYFVQGLAEAPTGRFEEVQTLRASGKDGEGGIFGHSRGHEEFKTQRLALDRFEQVLSLQIDRDQKTWESIELADAFESLRTAIREGESYHGELATEVGDRQTLHLSDDIARPVSGMPGPFGRLSDWRDAEIELSGVLESPQPLGGLGERSSGGDEVLRGAVVLPLNPRGPASEQPDVKVSLSWRLYRELPELTLEVSVPDYEDWRPTAAILGASQIGAGEPLLVRVALKLPNGATTDRVRIRRLRYRLEETSQWPGACLNWPLDNQSSEFDLKFVDDRARADGQELIIENLTEPAHATKLYPFDFGGTAILIVTADLDDGRTLEGRLQGAAEESSRIRLPKRAATSQIADGWKRRHSAVAGLEDLSDQEINGGQNKVGDGFTLFEEYRGVVLSRAHHSLQPEFQDVFVIDLLKTAPVSAAIRDFQRAAVTARVKRMDPHSKEIGKDRVVNALRGGGPSRGPQHAMELRQGNWPEPLATGDRPGKGAVRIPTESQFQDRAPSLRGRTDLYIRAIVQAMLENCGVWRPGRGDQIVRFRIQAGEDHQPVIVRVDAPNYPVRLQSERRGQDLAPAWWAEVQRTQALLSKRLGKLPAASEAIQAATQAMALRSYWVGVEGGEHSGPIENPMRNAFAEMSQIPGSNIYVVIDPREQLAKIAPLPNSNRGNGTNAPSHRPRSRFGDSPRGAPAARFIPNDHR